MAAKVLTKSLSNRNKYAKELRKPKYKQRVIVSKKVYNRKKKYDQI